jgi:hypothetical protein
MLFDPLSLHKVSIMAPFLGHMASSQQFWDGRGQNCHFLIRDQNHNIMKLRGRKVQFSLKTIVRCS